MYTYRLPYHRVENPQHAICCCYAFATRERGRCGVSNSFEYRFFYCSLMNQSSILIWNDFADFTAPPYAAGGFIIHLYLVLVFCSVYFGCDVRLCFMITMETVSRKQSNQRLVYVMFGSTTYEHDYFVHAVLIRRHWLLRIRKGLTNRIIRYIFLKR